MARLFDMCKMTVTGTPGTGTITLGSAVSGFQTFDDGGVTDGLTISYSIIDGLLWEVGRGVYTAVGTTLTRGALFSSDSGDEVDLTSAAIVWIAALAEDIIQSVTLVGNTDGTATPLISPDLRFAGGQNVTLSGTSNTISIIGPVTVAQSVQTLGMFAVGNTTGTTSSQTRDARTISFDGAGIASVGFSAGSIIISASTAATNPLLSIFAIGNTTSSVSSGVIAAGSLSFDGAGIVSVGVSNSSIVISASTAATNPLLSVFAVGNTTSSVSSGVIAAGSLSFDGAGAVSVGISNSSIVISSPASGAVQNEYAIGNTTAQSSSTTQTLSSVSYSGAGIVSVGFSTTGAGAGALVISASTAATNPLLSLFAVGNTTTSVSSGVNAAGSLSFDGAGIVSVGISGSSVVISAPSPAASGTVGNYFASGNTTAISSSSTHTLSNISVSGAGIVSVGISTTGAAAGILLISASTAATNPLLSIFAVGNTTTSVSSGVIAAGSMSFDGAGIVSVGVSNSSVVISAPASVGSLSLFAIGNTTISSSTSSVLPEALSFSGAGIVTVGYSSNTILLSANSIGSLSLFAVGNTTVSSSTSSALPEAISFSATGPLSIGYSSNTIIFSAAAAAAGAQSLFAVGNTTSSVSSGVAGAGSLSFAGTGAISVGISNSSLVISSPATSSLTGTDGITLSTNGSTISIGQQAVSFVEPRMWQGTTTSTWALGTMNLQPFVLQNPLTVNQINNFSSRAVAAPLMTFSSSNASRTVTASATWGSTVSAVVYSQQDATSFSTFSSTTASFGMSAILSGSFSSSSKTFSQTVTFGWPQGTSAAVTSSMSSTFSHVSSTAASQLMHTSSSLFANWLRNDIPFAASFPPGNFLMGVMWSSASGSSTLSTGLVTMSAPTWLASNGVMTLGPGTSVVAVPGAAISNPFLGIGSTSSAGSAVPGTVAWRSISSAASHPVNYFQMLQG